MAVAVMIIEFIRQFPPGVQIIEFLHPGFFVAFLRLVRRWLGINLYIHAQKTKAGPARIGLV